MPEAVDIGFFIVFGLNDSLILILIVLNERDETIRIDESSYSRAASSLEPSARCSSLLRRGRLTWTVMCRPMISRLTVVFATGPWLQILESTYLNFHFDFAEGQNTQISAK